MKELERLLADITKSNSYIYILGDFNINLAVNDKISQFFINTFATYNIHPLINKPTRIAISHNSIIENIFTNNNSRSAIKGIMCDEISDHLPIFTYIPIKSSIQKPKRPNIIIRCLKENNIINANDLLYDTFCNKESVIDGNDEEDVESAYNCFHNSFLNCINSSCPLLSKKNRFRKPWMSNSLYKCYIIKNNLHKQYLLNPTECNKKSFSKYRNYFTKCKRLAEKRFYEQKFTKCNKIKDKWKLINEAINHNKFQQTKLFNNNDTELDKIIKID